MIDQKNLKTQFPLVDITEKIYQQLITPIAKLKISKLKNSKQ
jgi:hypothetical protein